MSVCGTALQSVWSSAGAQAFAVSGVCSVGIHSAATSTWVCYLGKLCGLVAVKEECSPDNSVCRCI